MDAARRLVEEAVEIAARAGIDPQSVIGPHCPETGATRGGEVDASQPMVWCGVPVVVDDETTDLFAMPAPNQSPDQKPELRVTRSTAELVRQDFERYKPSLERMVEDWQDEKKRFMQEQAARDQGRAGRDRMGV